MRKSITAAATASGSRSVSARRAGGVRRARSHPPGSTAEAADGLDAAHDIAPAVRGVSLADVGQGLGVAEHEQRLFELSEVLRTDDDGRVVAAAGDGDPRVLARPDRRPRTDDPGRLSAVECSWPRLWRLWRSCRVGCRRELKVRSYGDDVRATSRPSNQAVAAPSGDLALMRGPDCWRAPPLRSPPAPGVTLLLQSVIEDVRAALGSHAYVTERPPAPRPQSLRRARWPDRHRPPSAA